MESQREHCVFNYQEASDFWGRKNGFLGEAVQMKVLLMQAGFVTRPFLFDEQIKKKKKEPPKYKAVHRKSDR